ncbi:hypothetical protein Dtox_3677 [Desulfofarcimen acetoxidans DSM 771]|uniref:Uncharacterized protein n=1 Tax=Desulfofarcimen acetoxidans (strain ATCC 49208 / DSM 771 / KCTC 5769 / VKM B-1644 / 5575) TaxID=485916 RepID=C8VWM2_DESAS|nr:hypothetical protein [Desulfofarcimen acetoxidans]ACV64386.1 hypothetical protein Dtox_3677 [Desulfofarcimen acetoxidans DSM 771]
MKHVNLTLEVLPAAKAAFQLFRPDFSYFVKQGLWEKIMDELKNNYGKIDIEKAVKALNELDKEIAESIGLPETAVTYWVEKGLLKCVIKDCVK